MAAWISGNSFTEFDEIHNVSGAIWNVQQWDGPLKDIRVRAGLCDEQVSIAPLGKSASTSDFSPKRLRITARDGSVLSEVTNFSHATAKRIWAVTDVAVFMSHAMWTYLTIPFLLTYPGVKVEDAGTIVEDGGTWRGLRATFSDPISTHTRTQDCRFGEDGLLRRHDYAVDMLLSSARANYASDYRDVSGIKVPFTRRVYGIDGERTVSKDLLLVGIDLQSLSFR